MAGALELKKDMESPVESIYDLDRFKMSEVGEKARITLLSNTIYVGNYHYIKPYSPEAAQSYGNYYECHADDGECFACKYSAPGDSQISIPKQRGIAQIAQFGTNRHGTVEDPKFISMTYRIYTLNKPKLNDLLTAMREYDLDKLAGIDILVECVSPQYHNHKLTVLQGKSTAMTNDHSKEQFKLLRQRHREDVTPLIGRQVTADMMEKVVCESLGIEPSYGGGSDLNYHITQTPDVESDFKELFDGDDMFV